MESPTRAHSRAWMSHLAVLAAYALLTGLLTWPLLAHFGEAVLGPPGDNLEYVWKLWWFKRALLEQHTSPFFNPAVFYPFGYPLALSETTVAHTVLGLPLTALWGEVVAYNTLVLGSFMLSGYGVYLLVRELGGRGWGAFVAGVAFAFCAYRFAHLGAGHLPLLGTGWVALLLWALERLICRPSLGRGALVGLFYALTALSSWYYAVMVGLFVALYLLLRARPWRKGLWRQNLGVGLLAAAGVAAPLLAPAALPLLLLYGQGEASNVYSLRYVDQWSASPLDFVYPNAMHPWWGAALTDSYYQNIHENLLYLGWVALALAGVGFWARRRERVPRVLAGLAVLTLILALGTTLHWAGKPVYLRVPAGVEYQFSRLMYVLTGKLALNKVDYGPLRQEGAIVLPLPTLLLYLFVPFMNAMRVWARFGVLTMLCVAVLAGWGVDWVLARLQGRLAPGLVGAGVLALLLVDTLVLPYPYGYSFVRGQPVDRWLAQQTGEGAVAQYPLEKTWYGWMLYSTRLHQRPVAYGYGTFAPQAYRDAQAVLADWPSPATVSLLKSWGVRYVLVGARSYGDAWPALQQAVQALPGVEEVAVFYTEPLFAGDRLLWRVRPTPEVPVTELLNGSRRAYLDDEVHVYTLK